MLQALQQGYLQDKVTKKVTSHGVLAGARHSDESFVCGIREARPKKGETVLPRGGVSMPDLANENTKSVANSEFHTNNKHFSGISMSQDI